MSYDYHKLLKFIYFEGYADSYEEAEYLLEEISDEEYDNLYSLYVRKVINELSQTEIKTAIGAEKNLLSSWGKPGHQAPGYKYGGRLAPNREGSGQVPEQKRFAQDLGAARERSKQRQTVQKQSYEYDSDFLIDENLLESHFSVGDSVICKKSGMKGKIVKLDNKEDGKYYSVKRDDGKTMKYSPDDLEKSNGGASKKREEKFHSKLDKLVHKTFGNSPEEKKQQQKEELDIYNTILSYLLDEGYAETADAAEVILSNMSEQWIETILEMDDFAAGGGNAKMKQTGMTKDQVIALGKKNLARKASSNTSSASTKAPEAPRQQLGATEADYKIAKLNKPEKPVKYGQQVSKGEGPKRYADAGKVTARHKFHSYQDSQNRADTIAGWYGLDRKNPETQKKMKDWADTNYRQNIAVDSDDPNYDPTKTSYPKFTPAKRDSRSAWNKLG